MTPLQRINTAIPLPLYCKIINVKRAVRGRPQRIRPFGEDGIHIASDGKDEIHICRRERHRRYKRGVSQGITNLARQYNLDAIDAISPGGVFVDCGANVGELGWWAARSSLSYIAFEPEPMEARCCDLNNFGGMAQTHRKGLWNADTVLEFTSKPESADSSIFEMGQSDGTMRIDVARLDSVLTEADLADGTRIFKLEAEGAEPEVLEGASDLIRSFDWVAVDCGYERGPSEQHTFVEVNRALTQAGFEAVAAEFKRVTFLYRNVERLGAQPG